MLSKALISTVVDEPVISPVTVQELADWLALNGTDTTLETLLKSATSQVIDYIGLELIDRKRRLIFETMPYDGTVTTPNLSGNNAYEVRPIPLLYSGTRVTLESVIYFGDEIISRCVVKQGKPSGLIIPKLHLFAKHDKNALEITYITGFGEAQDVPTQIKEGILTLAAFNYENRGGCASENALVQSGAAKILSRWRVYPEVF
ncbi:MAG: hypothetical protein LBB59_04555 [Campylobacteraceae bacterium]|jgi:hypothetical protein|nr:hypothetical protein [Campylobacteraceae bacterium]